MKQHKDPADPRLSVEEQDILHDLIHTGQIVTVLKLMKHFKDIREADLLTFSYVPGKEKELLHKKSKAMGATEFYNSFKRHLEKIKGRKLL